MSDMNNVGMDYNSMPIQAYAMQQNGNEIPADAMAGIPAYDPAEAERGHSSGMGMLGWLGILGLVGAGIWGGHYMGARSGKVAKEQLGKVTDAFASLEKKADEALKTRPFGRLNPKKVEANKDLANSVKKMAQEFKEGAGEATEKVEEAAGEAASQA